MRLLQPRLNADVGCGADVDSPTVLIDGCEVEKGTSGHSWEGELIEATRDCKL